METDRLTKVTAYITRKNQGKDQLLAMIEEGMESYGLQVPGGTVESGEELETCLLREIREEAGLTDVTIVNYLGEHIYFLEKKNAEIVRHYFHLTVDKCEDSFTVVVESQDEDNGWLYHYRWIDLKDGVIPELGGNLGVALKNLYSTMGKWG